jgi:hypothetical protein
LPALKVGILQQWCGTTSVFIGPGLAQQLPLAIDTIQLDQYTVGGVPVSGVQNVCSQKSHGSPLV